MEVVVVVKVDVWVVWIVVVVWMVMVVVVWGGGVSAWSVDGEGIEGYSLKWGKIGVDVG